MLTADEVRLDDPDFYASDPYPVYAQLRRRAPVFYYEPLGIWVLSRYEDIRYVSRHPELFSSEDGLVLNDIKYDQSMVQALFPPQAEHLMASDPPRHQALRKIIQAAFDRKTVGQLEDRIRSIANQLIDQIPTGDPFDFVETVAAPFPMLALSALMGLSGDKVDDFLRWAEDTTAVGQPLSQEEFEEIATDLLSAFQYFAELFDQRRHEPMDDLLTGLLDAEIDGERLNDETRLMFCQFLLAAGGETCRSALSGSMLAMIEHPEQRRIFAEDPDNVAVTASDEFLRWVTPAMGFIRTATEDTQIRDRPIAAGDKVYMLYPAANRDEAVWEDAERLDLTREPRPLHLAFGFGEHACLGMALARLETTVFWQEFMRRIPEFDLAGPPIRTATTLFNAWDRLPVVCHPA